MYASSSALSRSYEHVRCIKPLPFEHKLAPSSCAVGSITWLQFHSASDACYLQTVVVLDTITMDPTSRCARFNLGMQDCQQPNMQRKTSWGRLSGQSLPFYLVDSLWTIHAKNRALWKLLPQGLRTQYIGLSHVHAWIFHGRFSKGTSFGRTTRALPQRNYTVRTGFGWQQKARLIWTCRWSSAF